MPGRHDQARTNLYRASYLARPEKPSSGATLLNMQCSLSIQGYLAELLFLLGSTTRQPRCCTLYPVADRDPFLDPPLILSNLLVVPDSVVDRCASCTSSPILMLPYAPALANLVNLQYRIELIPVAVVIFNSHFRRNPNRPWHEIYCRVHGRQRENRFSAPAVTLAGT